MAVKEFPREGGWVEYDGKLAIVYKMKAVLGIAAPAEGGPPEVTYGVEIHFVKPDGSTESTSVISYEDASNLAPARISVLEPVLEARHSPVPVDRLQALGYL